jgi:alpha-beta hydrolase superfamily lysophospholipase
MPALPPQIEFYRAPDGRRLAVRVWRTAEPPRGRVVFLHGITSHGGWYSRSCQFLAQAGLEVHFLDRRGAGLNVESPGDVDNWQTWIDDVAIYLRKFTERAILSAPCSLLPAPILCGVSWGGKLAVAVARQHPELLGGLGLVCPGLFSYQEPGLLKRMALAAPLPARMAQRHVKIPLGDPALFIDDRRGQSFIAADPLALRSITLRSAKADRGLTRFARQAAPYLHMPILLMLAGRDRIVSNRRTRAFLTRTSGHKTLIEFPNATHTLEFEPDPQPYFRDLTNWIKAALHPGGQECC